MSIYAKSVNYTFDPEIINLSIKLSINPHDASDFKTSMVADYLQDLPEIWFSMKVYMTPILFKSKGVSVKIYEMQSVDICEVLKQRKQGRMLPITKAVFEKMNSYGLDIDQCPVKKVCLVVFKLPFEVKNFLFF